jgi:hypothetical protein
MAVFNGKLGADMVLLKCVQSKNVRDFFQQVCLLIKLGIFQFIYMRQNMNEYEQPNTSLSPHHQHNIRFEMSVSALYLRIHVE